MAIQACNNDSENENTTAHSEMSLLYPKIVAKRRYNLGLGLGFNKVYFQFKMC